MPHPFLRKLGRYVDLSVDDREVLRQLVREPTCSGPGHTLIDEGTTPRQGCVILAGWACCCKHLEDGRRLIIALSLPGDICFIPFLFSGSVNYSVCTLTSVQSVRISEQALLSVMGESPRIARALWLDLLAAFAIQREWTANIGFRTAPERIAHLLCEIIVRLQSVDATDGNSCILPLTQENLGHTVGLSTVHVNRTLQELRASGLITLSRQRLTILDFAALQALGHFDGAYLGRPDAKQNANRTMSLGQPSSFLGDSSI